MTNPTSNPFPRRPAWLITLLTLSVFVLLDSFDWVLFRTFASETEGWVRVGAVAALRWAPQAVAAFLVAAALFGPSHALPALGLRHAPITGLAFALATTSVMALGLAVTAEVAPLGNLPIELVRGALLPGLTEEIWYRAFLFGFLFRFARWGFLPAALLGAVIFGSAHLYQSGEIGEAAAIFAITALGGLWFAWLYAEWGFDLWVPVGFHVLMNAWWEVFAVSETALGSLTANAARLAVILLSVAMTLLRARRTGRQVIAGSVWWRSGPVEGRN